MSTSSVPIIVTRAEPGARQTREHLEALGLNVVSTPMLTLDLLPETQLPDAQDLAGLVFTSANGVRTYAERRSDRALTTWCVGPATAEAARHAGFPDIRESAGNAVDLANLISAHATPSDGPLLHVANAAATGTLKQTLTRLGFDVRFAPLYAMRPADTLPDSLKQLIDRGAPAIVLIHSAKGATALANVTQAPQLKTWHLVAISEQACAPLVSLARGGTHIATAPNEAGLMRALDQALATLSA
ncbi:MAG: uroporphyrinogen-III synthase [Pseudomonadota bacterium]